VIGPQQPAEVMREAGQRALRLRRVRAEIKRRLQTGEIQLEDVLSCPPDENTALLEWFDRDFRPDEVIEAFLRMRVSDLLRAIPGYGSSRVENLMETVRVSPSRRVRGLGSRQRTALVQAAKPSKTEDR
jgi:hypothetical protein